MADPLEVEVVVGEVKVSFFKILDNRKYHFLCCSLI